MYNRAMVDKNAAARQGWAVPILVSLAILLPQAASSFAGHPPQGNSYGNGWLANGLVQSLSQLMLLALIIGVSGRSREYGIGVPKPRDVPAAALILGGMLLIGTLVSITLKTPDRTPTSPEATTLTWPTLALYLGFSLGSAYREELFYRVYLLESFKLGSAPQGLAVTFSVVLFTLGHAYQGPTGMAAAALIGLFLAVAWIRGRSLHALAWGHGAYNLGILLSRSWEQYPGAG